MIEYWHWHTLHFGAETYVGGILPHSGRPGRVYEELARVGTELETAGPLVAGLEPDADITLVYPTPSNRIVHARELHDPSGECPGPSPEEAVQRHPVPVVPALYLAADTTLARFAAYAHAGGHLVLGPRIGYVDAEARARQEPAPGRLVEAAGAELRGVQQPDGRPPGARRTGQPAAAIRTGHGPRWVDGLAAQDAEVLATYDHPHFGCWAAATTRRHDAGRVTCVGTVPGRDLARVLAEWLAPAPRSGWRDPAPSVMAATATSPDGRRVHVIHNWGWDPATRHGAGRAH